MTKLKKYWYPGNSINVSLWFLKFREPIKTTKNLIHLLITIKFMFGNNKKIRNFSKENLYFEETKKYN